MWKKFEGIHSIRYIMSKSILRCFISPPSEGKYDRGKPERDFSYTAPQHATLSQKKTQVQLGLSQSIDPLCIFPGFYFYNCVCKMTLYSTYSVLIICRSTIYKVCFTVKKATIFVQAMLIWWVEILIQVTDSIRVLPWILNGTLFLFLCCKCLRPLPPRKCPNVE